jgi:signal transduction histidine kinase
MTFGMEQLLTPHQNKQSAGLYSQPECKFPCDSESTDENLSELAAALAHEIKNPAALALAHVSQLRRRTDLHGIGDACDHIEEALEKICCLVQEMLFATYGAVPAYEFDLADNLMDMLEAYQAAWPQITFSLEAPREGLALYGEETYVGIIFSNLIKNAVEATGGSGHVMINVSSAPGRALVAIQDSGSESGMPKPHASGLGLAICKWLLGRIGGSLEFNSSTGGGCEARVLLPMTT